MSARSPMVAPSMCTLCPTVTSSPMSVGRTAVVWMIEPSWMLVRAPTSMRPSSPRSTACGQTERLRADRHVADHDGVGVDVGLGMDVGLGVAEGVERHGRSLMPPPVS